jgi:hypothetical protein
MIFVALLLIRVNPKMSAKDALTKIEAIQHTLVPASPVEYNLVDVEYGIKFTAEQRIGKLASLSALLAILISCLGLFGLASFIAERKNKRDRGTKGIGASIFSIWTLLSTEFVGLVVISSVIAMPVAYYFLRQWLMTYYYHADLSLFVFCYTGVGVLVITLVTVNFQSIKAAIANPVKSLRSE